MGVDRSAATKPRGKALWPGYRWRVYAHHVKKRGGKDPGYTGESIDLRSDRHGDLVEFDELVIDDWFHLEQMNEREWWLGVGNGDDYWHVNVHIDRNGKATVQMEKQ
jgi:hypothetical protein